MSGNPTSDVVAKCPHGVPKDGSGHCEACCPDCQADIAEELSVTGDYCECNAPREFGDVYCSCCGLLIDLNMEPV
jgi:hypothetical protein